MQGTEEMIPSGMVFDVVITNFYLDLFSDEKLKRTLQRIHVHTEPTSTWLAVDFVDGQIWWHRWMLKIMYLFFRAVCDIEAKELPRWHQRLQEAGWRETHGKFWYGAFIRSTVWERR